MKLASISPTLLIAVLISGAAADATAQTTELLTLDMQGEVVNGDCARYFPASVTSDGRFVAFYSRASDLVANDQNGRPDVFVLDRVSNITERVSVDSQGVEANNECARPCISDDGRYVAFQSYADNLVSGDTNNFSDIFLHDRQTGITSRVNVGPQGEQADENSWDPAISADGQFIAFSSGATNLVPGGTGKSDIYVYDRVAGINELITLGANGSPANWGSTVPAISADGRYVAFGSQATNLVANDANGIVRDIFLFDRQLNTTELVSVSSSGAAANEACMAPSVSDDGNWIVFESFSNTLVAGDNNSTYEVFVHSRVDDTTVRVSTDSYGASMMGGSESRISGNGKYVVFTTHRPMVDRQDLDYIQVYCRDLQNNLTQLVSANNIGIPSDDHCMRPGISRDGKYIVFSTEATNLIQGMWGSARVANLYLHERWNGQGNNSFYLHDTQQAPVGVPMELTWSAAPPLSFYWLASARNRTGMTHRGHDFDIGNGFDVLASGVIPPDGRGSFLSAPVPLSAIGHLVFFEMAAQDMNGVLYDSNVIAVTFY